MESVKKSTALQFHKLSLQQKHILGLVSDNLRKPKLKRGQIKLVIAGNAGAGKSTLILRIKELLDEQQKRETDFSYIVASFTGINANQIEGFTLHHCFGLPLSAPKTRDDRHKFIQKWVRTPKRAQLNAVQFIIIDELSFIGDDYFVLIDSLLRAANPQSQRIPFGGKSIIICGDIFQLLPIKQRSLFQPSEDSQAYQLYTSISQSFVLEQVFRQGGQSCEQIKYRQFLDRLRHKKSTVEDTLWIRTRREIVLPQSEKDQFKDALRIFPYRIEVANYNKKALCERFAGKLVTISNNGIYLQIAVGCKVIFTKNVRYLVEEGVTNSSVGTVTRINLRVAENRNGRYGLVDINSVEVSVKVKGEPKSVLVVPGMCPLNTIPLALAYSVTIHRCQGIQLDKAVVHLGKDEFTTNSDYIVFSRVRSLNDIMIGDIFIDHDRLTRKLNETKYVEAEDKRLKRLQHACYREKNIISYLSKRSLGFFQRNGIRHKT